MPEATRFVLVALACACTPRPAHIEPVPACTLSLPSDSSWQEVVVPALDLSLRLPPEAEPAPPDFMTKPGRWMWWIAPPDTAWGFVSVWRAEDVFAKPGSWNVLEESRCILLLAGREVELRSMIDADSFGIIWYALAHWPVGSDTGIYLMSRSQTRAGVRTGLAILRSVWRLPPQTRP
jgi:hypothetical protein